ncbi:MAG: heme exporter protein CcmB [Legionellales bacterium]|jgi:heme exporter protein B
MSLANLFKCETLLLLRNPQSWLQGLLFFTLVMFILSFVLDAKAPLFIWLAALLAQLLAVDSLFKQDYLDGSLDLLLLGESLPILIIGKIIPHLLFNLIPLLVLTLLLSMLWEFGLHVTMVLLATLTLGMPILFLLGSLGAAFTVCVRNSSLLTGIILLPFYVPALLFAASAVQNAALGLPWQGSMALLGANFILMLILCPLASAGILKVTAG